MPRGLALHPPTHMTGPRPSARSVQDEVALRCDVHGIALDLAQAPRSSSGKTSPRYAFALMPCNQQRQWGYLVCAPGFQANRGSRPYYSHNI
jgi:hypothetical protein